MKKLVLMFVAMAGIMLASCGNKTCQSTANDSVVADSDSIVVDSIDSITVDSLVK